jgi:hypothetical protein
MPQEENQEVEIIPIGEGEQNLGEVLPGGENQPLIPQMNVSMQGMDPNTQKKCPISDEKLVGFYDEIHDDIKKTDIQIDNLLASFVNMVINEGDSTTASKEALVKLVELKQNSADKKAKIAELMTRLKVKDTYAYSGPHLNALQQNNVTIETRRDMLSEFQGLKAKQKKGK